MKGHSDGSTVEDVTEIDDPCSLTTKNCCTIARLSPIHGDSGESDSTVYYNCDDRFSQGDNDMETDQGNRQDFSSTEGTLDREGALDIHWLAAIQEKVVKKSCWCVAKTLLYIVVRLFTFFRSLPFESKRRANVHPSMVTEDKPDVQSPNGGEAVIGEDRIHPCLERLQKV